MRIRWGLLGSALACAVLLTAYENQTTSARALPGQIADSGAYSTADPANATLAPGEFRLTTGLDKEPLHIQGPVTCDTRDDTYRIAIGKPDAGGVEVGLSADQSSLKYADLGNRNGIDLWIFNDADTGVDTNTTPPVVRKAGDTYFVSGYATGTTAGHQQTKLYVEIAAACPQRE